MVWSIPIWILCQLVNAIVLLPLSFIGGAITSDWTITLSQSIQFFLRPLLYFQGVFDVRAAIRMIGWTEGVFFGFVVFLAIKFLFSLFRGHNAELHPEAGQKMYTS